MASLYKHTVLEILTLVSDLKGESSINTDSIRIRALDRANKDFASRKNWDLYKLVNQTTVGSGVADYTLGSSTYPARPNGLIEVFVATTGSSNMTEESNKKEIVDFEEYKEKFNSNNSDHLVYQYFDAANNEWKMHINPIPASTETLTYSYYWTPATLTTTSDSVFCYDPMILARLTNAYIYENEDEDKYQDQLQIAETLIGKWETLSDNFAPGQVKAMTTSYSGIGTK